MNFRISDESCITSSQNMHTHTQYLYTVVKGWGCNSLVKKFLFLIFKENEAEDLNFILKS